MRQLLKLDTLEYIALREEHYYLTLEREMAHPFLPAEVPQFLKTFGEKYGVKISTEDWFIFPARYEPETE